MHYSTICNLVQKINLKINSFEKLVKYCFDEKLKNVIIRIGEDRKLFMK